MTEIQYKALEIYHTKGHKAAWAFWRMMNMDVSIFLGEIPNDELIHPETLSNVLSVDDGTLHNNDTPWLKFILDGNLVYMTKKTIHYEINWDSLNKRSLIYGDTEIEINKKKYSVQLPKAASNNINNISIRAMVDTINHPYTKDSIWNRLLYPIVNFIRDENIEQLVKWESYNSFDLGINSNGNGGLSICQETYGSDISKMNCILKGYDSVSFSYRFRSNYVTPIIGWRPMLIELD